MIDTSRTILHHVSNLNTESQRISYQMGTGKNLKNGSENSLLHASIIHIEDKLRVTENLKTQLVKTNAANEVSDNSFAEMKNLLDLVKVDLMRGLNDGIDRKDKLALATNLEGIRENMFDLSNVRVDGEYVFSGSVTTEQTFVKDVDYKSNGKVTYNGDGFLRKIAVQPGSYRDRGVSGYEVGFYTNSSAISSERLYIEDGERVIDSEGHEWKKSSDGTTMQRYDHNGVVYYPPVEIALAREPSESTRIDLGIGTNTDANGTYTITIAGEANSPYSVVATGVESAEDIRLAFEGLLVADGYSVSNSLEDNDNFYVTSTAPIAVDISSTDIQYTSSASNEVQATTTKLAQKGVSYIDIPNRITTSSGETIELGHVKFESKHNYFDDINTTLNALNGYSTKLDGTVGFVIADNIVDDALRIGLDQTSQQFDATNIGHGELGGRNNVFNVAFSKVEMQETHYSILLQETSGADITKLAMESKALEMTYTGLYSTIMKMNELSLVNFIR